MTLFGVWLASPEADYDDDCRDIERFDTVAHASRVVERRESEGNTKMLPSTFINQENRLRFWKHEPGMSRLDLFSTEEDAVKGHVLCTLYPDIEVTAYNVVGVRREMVDA